MDGSPAASGQSLRGSVEVGRDSNGAKGATAEVSCHGGKVLSSKTEHGEELLFMSSKAACKPPHAMRGGIPICFSKACSWFGPRVKEKVLPFVRLISEVSCRGGQVLSWKTEHGEELLFMSSKEAIEKPKTLPSPEKSVDDDLKSIVRLVCAASILAPIERIKRLMQAQQLPNLSMIDCIAGTLQTEGLPSFWKGNTADMTRQIGLQVVKILAKRSPSMSRPFHKIGRDLALELSFYPFHFAHIKVANNIYEGALSCWLNTIKAEGPFGIYRGALVGTFSNMIYNLIHPRVVELITLAGMSFENELVDKACKDFLATFISRMIVFPLDTINQRLIMLSPESSKGVLLLHTVFEMMRNEGFRVLYKGAGAQAFLVAGTTCGVIIVVEVVWRKYFSK